MTTAKHILILMLPCSLVLTVGCTRGPGGAKGLGDSKEVILLTTTSFQDSGLADVLVPEFTQRTGFPVKVIAVGTGAALKQGSQGEGDVLLVHAPEQEKRWMAEGHGHSRYLVMYNDLVLAGPPDDPAKVKGQSPGEAFRRLATQKSLFLSRGDNSGTHIRELELWDKAGVKPQGQRWYTESGQGMGLTLNIASDQGRYTLTDRSTFLTHKKRLGLTVLVENDPALRNLYHVLTVNPDKFPRVNAAGAQALAHFLLSPEGQDLIGRFGRETFGQALFTPAAGQTEDSLLVP
jgi:tungstate transport system substrate-binding protein